MPVSSTGLIKLIKYDEIILNNSYMRACVYNCHPHIHTHTPEPTEMMLQTRNFISMMEIHRQNVY